MSLTGYSSAGRSPPEPASASPVEENRFIWIDLGCLKNAASSCHQTGVLLKIVPVNRQQIAYKPAGHFERGSVAMPFGQLGLIHGPQRCIESRRQVRCFNQRSLQQDIALVRDGATLDTPADSRCAAHRPQ